MFLRHRRQIRDEGGWVLAVVLAAIGLMSLVILALISMTMTDLRIRERFGERARVDRSVDGTLEVGINALKSSPGAVLGRPGECASLDGQSVTIDGVVSTLQCTPEAPTVPPVAGSGGVALTTLGGYTGTLDDAVDNRLEPLVAGVATGLATVLRNAFDLGPGVAHFGQDPLRIAGDVRVKNGAFGYRFTGTPATAGPSPAIDVVGTYSQGQCGPLGCIDFSLFGIPLGSSPPCGLLVPNVIPGRDFGTGVAATNGLSCNLGTGNSLFDDPAPAPPATWAASDLRSGRVLPAACPRIGDVVAIAPGAYDIRATKILNTWFAVGNCDNVTFWFPPGDYYFDAAGLWGGERNSLVLADPTARYVFGAARGWAAPAGAPAAVFPSACDSSLDGVSITLTVRTSIKHRAGLAAVCGRRDLVSGNRLPVVYQAPTGSAPVTWVALPTTAASPSPANAPTIRFSAPENALSSSGPVPASFPSGGPVYPVGESPRALATTSCAVWSCSPTLSLGGFSDPAFPAPYGPFVRDTNFPFAPQVSLKVRGDFAVQNPAPGYPQISWVVTLRDGSLNPDGTPARCNGTLPSTLPNNAATQVLTIPIGQACLSQAGLVDASQLEGATVDIVYHLGQVCGWFGCQQTMTAGIDYAWLEATTDPSSAVPAATEVAVDPGSGTGMYYMGPVYIPKSVTEIRWKGSANSSPLFVGGLVTRALASGPADANATNVRSGVVASVGLVSAQRVVTLRASVGGRLRGSARVVITDDDVGHVRQEPGRLLEVTDWQFCDRPSGDASCWAP